MNEFMKCAKELADDNNKTNVGGPFGDVIVKDGKIVGKGSNHVLKNNDPTAHDEVMAIRDACKNLNTYNLSGCTLYTSCYPRPMCMFSTMWANIESIYYGNTKEDADDIGFRDDKMYKYKKEIPKELNITQEGRDITIKSFEEYKNKIDKEIY